MNRKNIAIVAGGDSSEYGVSVRSGVNVYNAIDRNLFNPFLVRIHGQEWVVLEGENAIAKVDKGDFSFVINGERIKIDFAYIIIHGTPGEDGTLQGYFEMLGIPYSSCDVQSSALTFNKFFCNNYLRSFGIPIAKSFRLSPGEKYDSEEIIEALGLPLFVKPSAGGSSFGVTKVKKADEFTEAINRAMAESPEVMVEQFIEGKEFSCGVLRLKGKKLVFPVTEIIPKGEFFDYDAKYKPGQTDEITPARISDKLTFQIQSLSSQIYDLCNCSGIVRIDYILKDNTFYFLEVNTTPGMTATSFIPQQIKAMGLNMTEILTQVIVDRLKV